MYSFTMILSPSRRLSALTCLVLALGRPLPAQRVQSQLPRRLDSLAMAAAPRVFGAIDGIVSDTGLGPIQAAEISILRTNLKIGTGPNGRFRITNVSPGQYLLIVRRVGFRPASAIIDVPANDTVRLAYTLERVTLQLDTVKITGQKQSARLAEFYERQRLGFGEFMGPEEIAKRNSVYATDLFRKFLSINVAPSNTSAIPIYYALSKREGGPVSLGACPFTVYLDHVLMPTPFNLELLPSPHDLAGIEVYNGAATIPPQYSGFNRGCGVILIWTKDGY